MHKKLSAHNLKVHFLSKEWKSCHLYCKELEIFLCLQPCVFPRVRMAASVSGLVSVTAGPTTREPPASWPRPEPVWTVRPLRPMRGYTAATGGISLRPDWLTSDLCWQGVHRHLSALLPVPWRSDLTQADLLGRWLAARHGRSCRRLPRWASAHQSADQTVILVLAKCDPPCQHGGKCLPSNQCQCGENHRGPQCQYGKYLLMDAVCAAIQLS